MATTQENHDALVTALGGADVPAAETAAGDLLGQLKASEAVPTGSQLEAPTWAERGLTNAIRGINQYLP